MAMLECCRPLKSTGSGSSLGSRSGHSRVVVDDVHHLKGKRCSACILSANLRFDGEAAQPSKGTAAIREEPATRNDASGHHIANKAFASQADRCGMFGLGSLRYALGADGRGVSFPTNPATPLLQERDKVRRCQSRGFDHLFASLICVRGFVSTIAANRHCGLLRLRAFSTSA